MKPELQEHNDLLRWQWHGIIHAGPVPDSTYIAGFRDKKTAIEYGQMHGWIVSHETLEGVGTWQSGGKDRSKSQ